MLNYFNDPLIKEGYLTFLTQHIKDLSSIKGSRAFVWSPGFDELSAAYPVGSISRLELKCNLKDMFLYLRLPVIKDNPYGSTRAAPLWLDLQDYVGSMGTWDPPMAREDAAEWFNFLCYTTVFTSVRMNVEQLRRNGSFLIPAGPVELA